jgi:hypothetical protein
MKLIARAAAVLVLAASAAAADIANTAKVVNAAGLQPE